MADELLRALGARQATPPPGLEDGHGLLAPFEGAERAALLDDVLGRLESPPRQAEPSPAAAPVVELAARRRPALAWVGAVLASAAALLLWIGLRTPTPAGVDLPPYAATRLDGGTATMRAVEREPPSSLTLRSDASIDWILTPRAPVRSPVGAVLLATAPGQAPRLVAPSRLEVSPEGVVRIAGPLSEVLSLPLGTWAITIVLGPPDALPRTADAAAEAASAPGFSRVGFEVKISDAP